MSGPEQQSCSARPLAERVDELEQRVAALEVAQGVVGPHDPDMTDAHREVFRQRHEGEYAIQEGR